MSEAEASPRKSESAITARNQDTSRPTVGYSGQRPTKLRELIKGVNYENRHEEVNYVGSSAEIFTTDPNILSIENPVELEVLLTYEESSTWLLDSGALYHVTPHR